MYVCICVYMYVLCVYMYVLCVCMYVCMHQFCIISTYKQNFVLKSLCNFITKLHSVTNSFSPYSYCSCCSVLTGYNNVSWPDNALTVCSQLSVPFCTAIRNYKAIQYAISWQLMKRHWHLITLNSVCFLSVRSGTATSSVISLAFRAASGTVSSTVHKLYCNSEVFKYSTACTSTFSCISIKYVHKRDHNLSPEGRHFIPLS
jgi:hypothetical protein